MRDIARTTMRRLTIMLLAALAARGERFERSGRGLDRGPGHPTGARNGCRAGPRSTVASGVSVSSQRRLRRAAADAARLGDLDGGRVRHDACRRRACARDELEQRGPAGMPAGLEARGGQRGVHLRRRRAADPRLDAGARASFAAMRDAILVHAARHAACAVFDRAAGSADGAARPGRAAADARPRDRLARIEGGGQRGRHARDVRPPSAGSAAGRAPRGRGRSAPSFEYAGGGSEQRAPRRAAPQLGHDGTAAAGVGARAVPLRPRRAAVAITAVGAGAGARHAPAASRRPLAHAAQGDVGAVAGARVLRLARAAGRALAAGRYRARMRAADAAGLTSRKRTVAFKLT